METNESILKTIIESKGETRYKAFVELWNRAKQGVPFSDQVWNDLCELISDEKTDTTYIPLQILGTLGMQGDTRINDLIDVYISLISHPSVVIAPHAARYLCRFIKSDKTLEKRLLPIILNSEKKATVKHKGLFIAYVIEGLVDYYEDASDRKAIYGFVESNLDNESPKARKFAKDFLKKYPKV